MTLNLCPGDSVYGEKRVSVEGPETNGVNGTAAAGAAAAAAAAKIEYRVWNPFRYLLLITTFNMPCQLQLLGSWNSCLLLAEVYFDILMHFYHDK